MIKFVGVVEPMQQEANMAVMEKEKAEKIHEIRTYFIKKYWGDTRPVKIKMETKTNWSLWKSEERFFEEPEYFKVFSIGTARGECPHFINRYWYVEDIKTEDLDSLKEEIEQFYLASANEVSELLEGFEIVGFEHNPNSIASGTFRFPVKCLHKGEEKSFVVYHSDMGNWSAYCSEETPENMVLLEFYRNKLVQFVLADFDKVMEGVREDVKLFAEL